MSASLDGLRQVSLTHKHSSSKETHSTVTAKRPQENLNSLVRAVWRRAQCLHLSSGVLAFCRWGIPIFLAGMTIDWLVRLPAPGRVVILVVLMAVSLRKAWRHGWRRTHVFNETDTARQIEEHHGGLESLLASAVQLRDARLPRGTSESLRDVTCLRADEAAAHLRAEEIVGFQGLRRAATAGLLLAVALGVLAIVNGPFLVAGAARIFAPWLEVNYPTRTQLELVDGDLVVKEGARARIEARVSGVVPRQAKLALRTGKGRPRVLSLDITNGVCEYSVASAFRGFEYRVTAGDARTAWHRVQVIPSPRFERVEVGLEFPPYIQRSSETVEALTLTVPEGTRLTWHLTLDCPIRRAELNLDDEGTRPLQVSPDGRRVTMSLVATASRAYSFSWVEKAHGFSFRSPRHYLQVSPDQPPHVELTSPQRNLHAILGRPVDLVVRGRDDHGLAAATVVYRVNHTPEENVRLSAPIRRGGGEQRIDWDYRTVLTELNIGDSVSFAVELSDRYPGPQGPHRARSETRRVSFLSRQEYLELIMKQKDRLLSRVRAVYRQERAAYDLVRNLDPGDDVFLQTCQLEAVRQEIVRERLNLTKREVKALIDDLAANNVLDAVEGKSLEQVRASLHTIAQTHVAHAASLLRAQAGAIHDDASLPPDPAPAAHAVDTAARDLGSLVLQRGINSALEVFARELHVSAQTQSSLRLRSIETRPGATGDGGQELSKRQDDLAGWIARLLSDLQKGMRYTKRPLAVLRLSRLLKGLREAGVAGTMREAAALIRKGQPDRAVPLQTEVIRDFLSVESRVRVGAEYEMLLVARDLFTSHVNAQKELRAASEALTPKQFNERRAALSRTQATLREKLLLLLLPSIPAPRPHLFDAAPAPAPPVDDLLAATERAMAEAVEQINAGEREAAGARQREAEKSMAALAGIVDRRAEEVTLRTEGAVRRLAAAEGRLARLEEYETRQLGLLEKTEDAAADDASCASLAEPQKLLAEEAHRFRKELAARSRARDDRDVLPLLARLDRAVHTMTNAVPALQADQPDTAIEHQETATEVLAEAGALGGTMVARLNVFHGLLNFERGVRYASGTMADAVAEQRDLIAGTRKAAPGDLPALMPALGNLRRCLDEVAPLLDLVARRMDAGTPLLFAGSDIEDSLLLLEEKNRPEALDAQETAVGSLQEVQELVQAVAPQAGYLAEIVEFLNEVLADAAFTVFRQEQLRERVQASAASPRPALVEEQRALQSDAETFGRLLRRATGQPRYTRAARHMADATDRMTAGDSAAAVKHMRLAEATLNDQATELFDLMRMLRDLPGIEVMEDSPKDLLLLLDVLAVASEQRDLYRKTQLATPEETASLATRQGELEARCRAFVRTEQPHPKLASARRHLSAAASALKPSSQAEATRSQQAAGEHLRHFIVEQALRLATPPPGPEEPTPGGEIYVPGPDMLIDFAAGVVSGELPKNKRVEWEALGRRTRAALNENFARELPLEYRGLLKNYYERVAK